MTTTAADDDNALNPATVTQLKINADFRWRDQIVRVVDLKPDRLLLRLQTGEQLFASMTQFIEGGPVPIAHLGDQRPPGDDSDVDFYGMEVLSTLTPVQQERLRERAAHVNEVLTGYASGWPEIARRNEPRKVYDPAHTPNLHERIGNKAEEINKSPRTIWGWIRRYRAGGLAALIDGRSAKTSMVVNRCDQRWVEEVNLLGEERTNKSSISKKTFLRIVKKRVKHRYKDDEEPVQIPGDTMAYEALNELSAGKAWFDGAKARRSRASAPSTSHGRLEVTRPGQMVMLDTTRLDVYALDRVTRRWTIVELTIAIDVFSRVILGLRLTPISTRAIDVASVLWDVIVPTPAPANWPAGAGWPYIGLPEALMVNEKKLDLGDKAGNPSRVLDEGWITFNKPENKRDDGGIAGTLVTAPTVVPEAFIVDHGKIYFSQHVRSICRRLGISIQPARIQTGSDKANVETFFGSVRTDCLEMLPGYKGFDVLTRGKNPEAEAFYFIDELEAMLREWVACRYHHRLHDGISEPSAGSAPFTPLEMFNLGVARTGHINLPADPWMALEFLPVHWRAITRAGIQIDNFKYDSPVLDPYRGMKSPYKRAPRKGSAWPFWQDPSDLTRIWFRDPDNGGQPHQMYWKHARRLGRPLTADTAALAKRHMLAEGHGDLIVAIEDLMTKWGSPLERGTKEFHAALRERQETRDALSPVNALPPADYADAPFEPDDDYMPPQPHERYSSIDADGTDPQDHVAPISPEDLVSDDDTDFDLDDIDAYSETLRAVEL